MISLSKRPVFLLAASVAVLLVALAIPLIRAGAEEPATDEFAATWQRTDFPVSNLSVNRTWVWGPQGNTGALTEPYADAPGGQRTVQYFDKARMEIPIDTDVEPDSPWYVTTGLLPLEMMRGELQLGDDLFEQHAPAEINIAGDPSDASAPTYAEMAGLIDALARPVGETIIATVDENGQPGSAERFAGFEVSGAYFVPQTSHTVASVFWDFMNSSGPIYVDGQMTSGPLFQDPFFGFGLPVTEAYWSRIELAGEPTDILIQVFERRVATYTPDNPDGWKVETGNVGQHYHQWRYEIIPGAEPPAPTASATATEVPPAISTPSPTPTEDEGSTCQTCEIPYGLGEIGTAGKESLGEDAINPLLDAYLAVEQAPNDVIDQVVVGSNGTARLNFPDSISVVSDWSPSDKLFYVVDFNDGSAHVTNLVDAHYGFFVTHTYLGRGEFHIKVWAVDPEAGVRTPIVELTTTVE